MEKLDALVERILQPGETVVGLPETGIPSPQADLAPSAKNDLN